MAAPQLYGVEPMLTDRFIDNAFDCEVMNFRAKTTVSTLLALVAEDALSAIRNGLHVVGTNHLRHCVAVGA